MPYQEDFVVSEQILVLDLVNFPWQRRSKGFSFERNAYGESSIVYMYYEKSLDYLVEHFISQSFPEGPFVLTQIHFRSRSLCFTTRGWIRFTWVPGNGLRFHVSTKQDQHHKIMLRA